MANLKIISEQLPNLRRKREQMKAITENLKNPDMKYRPVPFWSWNDKLSPDELRKQIRAMHDAGLGGYFMHARGGLLTEYMGEEWFDCVKASVDEGRKLDMNSWAYDENGWPSGFGDGMVNGLGLDYQQKYLRIETAKTADASAKAHTIGFFETSSLKPVKDISGFKGEEIVRVYFDVNPYYVDTLDDKVIDVFIDKIYADYKKRLSKEDWETMRGFFTDEPQVSRNGIPWSFIMEREYKKAYGEELLPLLPELFREEGSYTTTRYRFWRLVTILFMNNFMKKIYDWCEANGCMVTGHHVCEETYNSQLTCNGAIMPHYQYYHIPGMDWLGRRINPVTTPVQVASVCAQVGKKQIMSETFALCGWAVTFEDLKWMYQWQMVHGINFLCQHLESYSLKGIRKRDYPASLFFHQPWWGDYRKFNDYMTRIGILLAEGEINTDVLILHGQSSAWLCFNNKDNKPGERYFDSFNSLSNLLDQAHVNYHYGDETMIAMHGSVKDKSFVIGKQSYKLVIVPKIKNLSPEVFELLKKFVANGGKVLVVKNDLENTPVYIGGELKGSEELLSKTVLFQNEEELVASVGKYVEVCPTVVKGTPASELTSLAAQAPGIIFTKRSYKDLGGSPAKLYYFTNSDLKNGVETEIYLDGKSVQRFEPETAEFVNVYYSEKNGKLCVPHFFSPAGDILLVVSDKKAESAASVEAGRQKPGAVASGFAPVQLDGTYKIDKMSENLLTLDYCRYSVDGELKSENEYVLSIHDKLLALEREADLEMDFKFKTDSSFDLSKELFLIMEIPEKFEISVNGKAVASKDCGYLFDSAFRKISIKGLAKSGENIIKLKTRFAQPAKVYDCLKAAKVFESEKNKLSYGMEIEAIYLAGDFGVKADGAVEKLDKNAVRYPAGFTLTAKPVSVNLSKIHEANLPFFSGSMSLSNEFEIKPGEEKGRLLVFEHQNTMVSEIRVNGKKLTEIIWKPFCVSLDGFLKPGKNSIEIELRNSLRNMLGPHHLAEGESYGVGPASFYKDPGIFSRNWSGQLNPWNEGYCFVEFGINKASII